MTEIENRTTQTDDVGHAREADLERVMAVVPRGAAAIAGAAVVLILLAWLLMYFLVFLPRGPVN
jgi:hypothetical protein